MIDAYQRGHIEGGQEASTCNWPYYASDILPRAKQVFDDMKTSHYAHIEPEQEFVRGFCDGFNEVLTQKGNMPYFVVVDEPPALVAERKDSSTFIEKLLREGRK